MEQSAIIAKLQSLLQRPTDSQKYDFGHVLVVGGSAGMAGAPMLAATAALRSGAGLVTVGSVLGDELPGRALELMTYRLAAYEPETVSVILKFIKERKVSMLVLGSGMPAPAAPFIRELAIQAGLPVVLDAGGLTAFQDHLDELHAASANNPNLILTPHAGEYQKLSGQAVPRETAARQQAAHIFAHDYPVILLLKGQPTLVTGTRGLYENKTGNPGMATAGSGDVLAGIIAALSAQGFNPFEAAAAGAYLHALAGDLAAVHKSQPGMVASDIIDNLPAAFLLLAQPSK